MFESWETEEDALVCDHELAKDPFWGRFVREVGSVAPDGETEDYKRERKVERGLFVVEMAAQAVNDNWWERTESESVAPWYHKTTPALARKKRLDPYITVRGTEDAAASYLELPYRLGGLDRLLVDMLIAAEMFAFADEMQPQLNQKFPLVLGWVWGNVKGLVCGLAIAVFLYWIAPNSTVMNWASGIIGGITLVFTAISVILFPFLYPTMRKQRDKFNATIMSMLDAYRTLDGTPASVPHIRKMVDRATDAGVVWPSSLMVLLDDIASRKSSI